MTIWLTPNSALVVATVVEKTDEAEETTKVLSAVSSVISHFRQRGMLSGFSGSCGPSHSTRLGSLPWVRPSCLVRRASSSEGRYWWQWWHVEKSWEEKSLGGEVFGREEKSSGGRRNLREEKSLGEVFGRRRLWEEKALGGEVFGRDGLAG